MIERNTNELRTLAMAGGDTRLVANEYLVSGATTLSAARFDLDRLRVVGRSVPVLSGVRTEVFGAMQWDVSNTGILVYAPGRDVAEGTMSWVNRNGVATPLPAPFQGHLHGTFQVSPNGQQVAVSRLSGTNSDIWIYDLERQRAERLTVSARAYGAIWSGDGTAVAYTSFGGVEQTVETKRIGAVGDPTVLARDSTARLTAWSDDGRLVVLDGRGGESGGFGVSVLDLQDPPIVEVAPDPAWGGVIAPNNRAVAYTSAESGEYQIYMQPYPPTGQRLLVSRRGGSEEPIWSRDGRRLFYRSGQRIMEAKVSFEPELSTETPIVAYEGDFVNVGGPSYGVSPDGNRFLIIEGGQGTTTSLRVVVGWFNEVRVIVDNERQ